MKIQSLRGMHDLLPDQSGTWQYLEKTVADILARYSYREIRFPIVEQTELFKRSVGEATDIVEKEMYTFEDRGGDSITLRPEGTASVVRAYIEHKMYAPPSVTKMFYIGPMFRYERPQAGRLRQFYQIGVEAMGSPSPTVDVEVMTMLIEFFHELGIEDSKLQINSLGNHSCRPQYKKILQLEIKKYLNQLCKNCNNRYEKNPLRVLDCKVEQCKEVAKNLPKMIDHLDKTSEQHFTEVQKLLDIANTPYTINTNLVRGLDYYNMTAFEVTSDNLGSQNAICGGGRYDTLVEELSGPSTPCFGFALGLERLVSLIPFKEEANPNNNSDIFLICLGEVAKIPGFQVAHELRLAGFKVERDYEMASMKSQMRKANKSNCRFTLIIGESEVDSGKYVLKNMENSEQHKIDSNSLTSEIEERLK